MQPSSEDSRDWTIPEPGTLLVTEMKLLGVRVEMPPDSPVVLLKEAHGNSYLPSGSALPRRRRSRGRSRVRSRPVRSRTNFSVTS